MFSTDNGIRLISALVVVLALCTSTEVHAESDPIVSAVQQKLVDRGYDLGAVDGALGQRTQDALGAFQRVVGLPDTGRIDDRTLAALGMPPLSELRAKAGGDTTEVGPSRVTLVAGSDIGTTETPHTKPEPVAKEPKPPPKRATPRRLSFATLGWHPPQTGARALARFNALGAPPVLERGKGTLVVPKGELVFVLEAGERFPGLDCDSGAGRLSVEFVFGPDGPILFTPLADGDYCQAGIGIALRVGSTLEMRRIDWRDVQHPRGTVRITDRGLEYVE